MLFEDCPITSFLTFEVLDGGEWLHGVEDEVVRLEVAASLELGEVGARPEVLGSRLAPGHPPQLQPKSVVVGAILGPRIEPGLSFCMLWNVGGIRTRVAWLLT